MALEVVGAGLGRTGTLSLKMALERLGFGPCYHMKEVFEHSHHVAEWDRAAAGAPDWDAILGDYRSAVDFPVAAFWSELAAHYPDAKVVLTVRDADRWFQSCTQTIFPPLLQELPERMADWQAMVRRTILDRTFESGDLSDRDHAVGCFHRHNEAVRQGLPADRLLVFDVAEGWGSLCDFLGVAVPDEPFPRVNSTEEFRRIADLIMQPS